MTKNNIFIFSDIDKLGEILSQLVIDGNLNLNIMPRHDGSAEWLYRYWGATREPIPVTVTDNKISFLTVQELHIDTLMRIAKIADKGNIEYLAASDKLGEGVKHITIGQQVPVNNSITINPKEFACLVWDKDYYDYLKKAAKGKEVSLDDIANLDYSDDDYSSILAVGGLNALF